MADAFADRLDTHHDSLKKLLPDKVDVPQERRFVGFDVYKELIDSGVDVVLLATPPHFRPMHMEYAVARNKHVFSEKPMAVDAAGVRSVLQTAQEAKKKNLCLVSGFCFRYDPAKRETIARLHDGAIGDILAIQANYNTGLIWDRGTEDPFNTMEYQMRNWYYYTWLSGDHIVEQHCHNLDKAAWVFNWEWPESVVGLGGRQVRTEARFGNIFDHHAVVFEYKNGRKLFSYCRQYPGRVHKDVSDHILGTNGQCQLMDHAILGPKAWAFEGEAENMYQVEHNEMFAAIRAGEALNDMESAAYSSLMAIMGRMATYTGEKITWKQALSSKEVLGPSEYQWGELPIEPVARPGETKFV
jgi:predicted dehydrogenase